LPPYIEREPDASDTERYQTVFASTAGAVAAPTAGLHFSQELLQQLQHEFITLHVGVGTFKPVKNGSHLRSRDACGILCNRVDRRTPD